MIKPLTSLRFFFAFMVLMMHFQINEDVMFSKGYIGVGFFFMLSGFILSYSYAEKIKKTSKLLFIKSFYIARIARIYPVHLTTFIIMFILHIPMISKFNGFVLLSNLFLVQSWFPYELYYFSYNAPSWSISNEMFFYLLFPFILNSIFILDKYKKNILFFILIAIYLIILVYGTKSFSEAFKNYLIYISPVFRLVDFIIGIYLYLFWLEVKSKIQQYADNMKIKIIFSIAESLSILIFIAFLLKADSVSNIYSWDMYYWLPMALVIFVFSFSRGFVSDFLSRKIFVYLGEISFAFYMYHYLVLYSITSLRKLIGISIIWQFEFLVIVLLTLTASVISFEFLEKPANIRIKKMFKSTK